MTDSNSGNYLKVISTPEQIRFHPLNNSRNKQFCVFSRQNRFSKQKSFSTDVLCYEINRDFFKNARTTNFGYGQKFNFTNKNQNVPGPENYNLDNHTIGKNAKKKGFIFGESWEKCYVIGIKNPSKENELPGPGTYSIKSDFNKESKKGFQFRQRILMNILDKENQTGPGKYNPIDTNPKNQFILSKFRNQGQAVISPLPDITQKKSQSKDVKPHQLVYDLSFQLNPKGRYFNSKYKNITLGKIQTQKWMFLDVKDNQYPGPGFYQLQSEFGFYRSSKFPVEEKAN